MLHKYLGFDVNKNSAENLLLKFLHARPKCIDTITAECEKREMLGWNAAVERIKLFLFQSGHQDLAAFCGEFRVKELDPFDKFRAAEHARTPPLEWWAEAEKRTQAPVNVERTFVGVGSRLRWCREQAGISQKELADKIGRPIAMIEAFEVGNDDGCADMLTQNEFAKIASVFGTSVGRLFGARRPSSAWLKNSYDKRNGRA